MRERRRGVDRFCGRERKYKNRRKDSGEGETDGEMGELEKDRSASNWI